MMMLTYAWREITRRKTRTMLTVTSIFFAIALFVSVSAILNFFKEAVSLPFKVAGADMVVETFTEPGPWTRVRLARHLGPIPVSVIDEIRNLPGVEDVSGILLFWSWEGGRMINIAAVDPKDLERVSPISTRTALGRMFTHLELTVPSFDGYSAILDRRFAKAFQLDTGSQIELAGRKFTVVGIVDYAGVPRVGQAEVFIPLDVALDMVRESHEFLRNEKRFVNMLLVKLKSGSDYQAIGGKIRQIVANATKLDPKNQVKIFTSETILPDTTGVSMLTQQLVKVIAVLMVIGIALLVAKTSAMAVAERTQEIGIMKAVGWRDSEIARLILTENFIQGLMGGVLGCIVGYAIAFVYAATAELKLPPGVVPYSCVPAAAPPQNLSVAMKLSWELILLALVIAIVMGLIGGYLAAKHASSMHPAEALRRL